MEDGVASDLEEWAGVLDDVLGDMFDAAFLAHGVDLADGVGPETGLGAEEEVGDDIFACAAETGDEEGREREPSEASDGASRVSNRFRCGSSGGRAWICVVPNGAV